MRRFFIRPKQRVAIYILVVFVVAYGIGILIAFVSACHPIAYVWNSTIPGGHCVNFEIIGTANLLFSVLTDMATVIMPIIMLKSLRLPRAQKWGMMFVFALGGL